VTFRAGRAAIEAEQPRLKLGQAHIGMYGAGELFAEDLIFPTCLPARSIEMMTRPCESLSEVSIDPPGVSGSRV
jgi:hypothetical protein